MDSLIGIKCNNFVLIASDMNSASGIIMHKTDENKFYQINNTVLAYAGDQGEAFRLCEYITELSHYLSVKHNIETSPQFIKNILQQKIHSSLRQKQIGVGCLVGGPQINGGNNVVDYDLHMVDSYGATHTNSHFCIGYANYFGLGILDKYYKKDMTIDEGVNLVKRIIAVMNDKFLVGYRRFMVKIISESGIDEVVIESNQ